MEKQIEKLVHSSIVEELAKTLHGKILHTLDRTKVEENAGSIFLRPDHLYDMCYAVLRVKNRDNDNIILACIFDLGTSRPDKLEWIAYPYEMGNDRDSPRFEEAKVIPLSRRHRFDDRDYRRGYDGQQQFTDSTLDLLEKAHNDIANVFYEEYCIRLGFRCTPWDRLSYARVKRSNLAIYFPSPTTVHCPLSTKAGTQENTNM